MKFLKQIICLVLLYPVFGIAGGSEVGNGGGLAEKNITFAYLNLEKYLELCLKTSLCHLSADEAQTLAQIQKSLVAERKSADQLKFVSGKKQADAFKIDGIVRVAKTGDSVGSPILINSDLLYWPKDSGGFQAMDLPAAVSVLVHELGHHHGIKDHEALDILGSKVQQVLLKQSLRTLVWNGDFVFTILQNNLVIKDEDKKKLHDIDQVLISYEDQLLNLTSDLLKEIHCPSKDQTIKGLRIYNLHTERGVRADEKESYTHVPVKAWYILSCKEGEESDHGDLNFNLALLRNKKDQTVNFIAAKSSFSQASCLQDKSVCK